MTTIIKNLQAQLQVLQEASKTYSGKTIDNIICQIEMRLNELQKHKGKNELNELNELNKGTMNKKTVTWHPSTVMPQDGRYIIVNVIEDVCFLTVLQNGNYAPSEGFRPPFTTTKQWAYIEDLLPAD